MKTLSILPPNKTRTFYSPLYSKLVRTGVIGDGSCLLHALYYAISQEYKSLSLSERVVFISNVREKLASRLSLADIKSLGRGELFKMIFMLFLREVLSQQSLQDWDHWDNVILVEISNTFDPSTIESTLQKEAPHLKCIGLVDAIEQRILEQLQQKMQYEWVDDFCLEYLSRVYERNFLFIKADDRLSYKVFQAKEYASSVVFCWIEESHYEIIGELQNDLRVLRDFPSDHPFIQAINMKLEK